MYLFCFWDGSGALARVLIGMIDTLDSSPHRRLMEVQEKSGWIASQLDIREQLRRMHRVLTFDALDFD